MPAEALTSYPSGELQYQSLLTARSSGEVVCLPDGRAGVVLGLNARAVGDAGTVATSGVFPVAKAASVVIIKGAPIWFDHSANACTPVPQFADRDFYLGCATEDVAAGGTYVPVDLNVHPRYIIDAIAPQPGAPGGGDTAIVLTAGTPYLAHRGGCMELAFSATAEAQKVDWMSIRTFPLASNWVLEAVIEVVTTCDADVGDLTVGVANGTHASDFQSVGEFVTFHFDLGADLDLDAQSDDGTTDVAPTDTTINWAEGTPIHLVIDGRDPSDCQLYVNGILVLGSTVFTLAAATGPLKAIVHLEKSSNDSPGVVQVHALRVRIMDDV